MNRLILFAGTLLLATACAAQNEASGRSLVEGAKLVKINLVDAVQKANKACAGQVVGAMLEVGTKEKPAAVYAILVLREGKLWRIDVDAQSGTVGQPRATDDDDDDDDNGEMEQKGGKGEKGEAHAGQPATGKEMVMQNVRLDFEDAKTGALPAGWRAAETSGNGKLATWRVEERADAASGKHVLSLVATENSGSTFNMVLSDAVFPADLALSVMIHANTGIEDQGGGLVWRAQDAGNYYLARWNPLEDNLRCYKVFGERRTMFKSVGIKADPKAWHQLEVAMQGKTCTIAVDGKEMLTFEDDTFAKAGKVGVWTKADAASSFDDLQARAK